MEIEAQNAIYLGEETGGRGRQFRARFLVPGLVKYDYGVCLLTKENADKFIQGFTGCPVVINHQNVTDDNVKDVAVGDIFSVWFDNNDGYYWCNGIIRDKEAIKLINEGYSVSCQYLITEYSDNTAGKLHNGNPYDKVIENGKPEHLAIVNNPRYEGAIIAVNAIMAENADKWITIKPNGDDAKGKHLLLKDGETPQEAIERQYGNGGQMALGFPGAKKAQKDAKSYENKKIASRDKLYSVYMNDDVKEYGKKLVEALKEYNKYNDDGVNIDNIDDFVEKYEKQRDEEKTKTEYKKYVKEQSQKESDKESKKQDKSGVDSAEKRRIIDRVIDIHKRSTSTAPKTEDFSQYGFNVERNTDINRLQLKFDGKPDASTRSILKSYGFRWSPREGAWQRQLTRNAEYSLKQIKEKLTANNAFVSDFKDALYEALAGGIVDRLGELLAQNKSNNPKEKWITIKGNHILLKDGESLADAFQRVTGVSFAKANKYEKKDNHKPSKEYEQILKSVRESNNKELTADYIINNAVKNQGLNAQEVREKINFAEEYNSGIIKQKLETNKKYSNLNHSYKQERQEKHNEILEKIFANKNNAKPKNGEKPTVIFLGGRGGSGKSKFDMPDEENPGNIGIYDKSKYIVLDADEIKKMLPEYQGYNAYEVHEESSDILNTALAKARKEGLNVVLDATMKTLSSTEKKIKAFDEKGYNIEMYYMHLPREKAAERAIGRFMGKNGRYVPMRELFKMKDNEENFDKLKHYASKWAFYNNDVPSKENKPILIDKNF